MFNGLFNKFDFVYFRNIFLCKVSVKQLIFRIMYLVAAGVAAMGKTYTLAAFANEWAQEGKTDATQSAKIKSFDLIFLLRLRNVTSNVPLETDYC